MPLRDDREAARHRIDALERQLEEERERARRAEDEADAAKEMLARRSPSGRERDRDADRASRERSEAPSRYRRAAFERGVVVAVCLWSAPVWLLHVGWRHDLAGSDERLLGWSFLPVLPLLVTMYVLARRFRAPYPSSAVSVGMLAAGVGWLLLLGATTDMFWGDVLATPPWRWVTRGLAGALAVGFHAVFASRWCSEAVLAKPDPAGD